MANLRLTLAARADLRSVRAWLRQNGAAPNAVKRLSAIEAALRDLGIDPVRWPEGEHVGTRERSVAGYRLIYRIVQTIGQDVVIILRIFGPGQDRRRVNNA